jgi:hypothetical protein
MTDVSSGQFYVFCFLRVDEDLSQKHSYAKFVSRCNFDCIKYPVIMSQIKRFEDLYDLAINVFTYTKKEGLLPNDVLIV